MTKAELEKKRDLLSNWISAIDFFPQESERGKIQDNRWRKQLVSELRHIENLLEDEFCSELPLCGSTRNYLISPRNFLTEKDVRKCQQKAQNNLLQEKKPVLLI